jgi:hypothetical protein
VAAEWKDSLERVISDAEEKFGQGIPGTVYTIFTLIY